MKAVAFEKAGAALQVVDLVRPSPDPDQILVKSVYMAINPVDAMIGQTGLLVTSWPVVLGCDAAGVVVEAGYRASEKFKIGEEVCGCTRLATPGHSPGQEFFLMDSTLTMHKPKNISLAQAATIGAGSLTASLALFNGLGLPLPSGNRAALAQSPNEWLVVLGGAGSVGKYAIQLGRACGLNVVASCSNRSFEIVQALGAHPFDYKQSIEDQFKEAMSITGGNCNRIFDASSSGFQFASYTFKELSTSAPKVFATTNDWSGIKDFEGGRTYEVELGPIGRPEAKQLNEDLARFIPLISALIEQEKVVPNDLQLMNEVAFEAAIKAIDIQQSGAAGNKKVVVQLQEP